MTVEVVERVTEDLDFLFDDAVPCSCRRDNDTRDCPDEAVANGLLRYVCTCFVADVNPERWFLMCTDHLRRAHAGELKCGHCFAPGGWLLLKEVSL